MSKLAQFIASAQEQQQDAAVSTPAQAEPAEPAAGRLSQFVRRISLSRRPSAATPAAAPTAASSPPSLHALFGVKLAESQPAFALAKQTLEWKAQGVFDNLEEFGGKTDGKTPQLLALELAQHVVDLETALMALQQQASSNVGVGRPPLLPSSPARSSNLAPASSSPRHQAPSRTAAAAALASSSEERTDPIIMNKFTLPVDLSNETTVDIQDILHRVNQELESRGGFQGEVYTFLKRKDGNMLNRDGLYVGGKIASQFEFRCDTDRKIKLYFISAKCRGTAEPVEDLISKARDQSKYQLALDPDDDMVIVGCYKI
ncbi:hypothetical protein BASA81_001720 [Batrachochytrium salamandrivorans]|nr:hypothetical protein BASA81_001720 [Batrachochytrium salamandrivorans]